MWYTVCGTHRIIIIYDKYITVDSAGDNKLKIILPKTGQCIASLFEMDKRHFFL